MIAGACSAIFVVGFKLMKITGMIHETSRMDRINLEVILNNLRKLYYIILGTILPTANRTYPKNALLIFLLAVYAILFYAMHKRRAAIRDYFYLIVIILISRAAVYAPHMLASSVWTSNRSIMSFWTILSLPLLFIEFWRNVNLKKIVLCLTILILGFNIASSNFMEISLLATNRIDREISYLVQARINDYENQTGIKIKRIIYGNDERPTWIYPSVGYSGYELCSRAWVIAWGTGVGMLTYFNNRPYQKRHMTSEEFERIFVKKFRRRNWDVLDLKEQLVFIGDECYLVAY